MFNERIPLEKNSTVYDESTGTVYIISNKIGSGSNCIVYKAQMKKITGENDIGQTIILKEFYPISIEKKCVNRIGKNKLEHMDNSDEYNHREKRFIDSFEKMNQLHNENNTNNYVTTYNNMFRANGTYYIASKYDYAVSFKEFMKCKTTDLKLFLNVLINMTEVVKLFHNNGYWCLDLTPENILLFTYTAGNHSLKFIDTDSFLREGNTTRFWDISRTQGYAPPELFRINESNFPRIYKYRKGIEVFSIGAIFYEYLFGHAIETADDMMDCFKKTAVDFTNVEVKEALQQKYTENIRDHTVNAISKFLKGTLATRYTQRAKLYKDMQSVEKELSLIIKTMDSIDIEILREMAIKNVKNFGKIAIRGDICRELLPKFMLAEKDKSFIELMDECQQRVICLWGNGGAGKTASLIWHSQNQTAGDALIIYIPLKRYGRLKADTPEMVICQYILAQLSLRSSDIEPLKEILKENKCIICFDGYNEVSPTHQTSIMRAISSLVDEKHLENLRFLITSRAKITDFDCVNAETLNIANQEIAMYLWGEPSMRREVDQLLRKFGGNWISNPMMLRIYRQIYRTPDGSYVERWQENVKNFQENKSFFSKIGVINNKAEFIKLWYILQFYNVMVDSFTRKDQLQTYSFIAYYYFPAFCYFSYLKNKRVKFTNLSDEVICIKKAYSYLNERFVSCKIKEVYGNMDTYSLFGFRLNGDENIFGFCQLENNLLNDEIITSLDEAYTKHLIDSIYVEKLSLLIKDNYFEIFHQDMEELMIAVHLQNDIFFHNNPESWSNTSWTSSIEKMVAELLIAQDTTCLTKERIQKAEKTVLRQLMDMEQNIKGSITNITFSDKDMSDISLNSYYFCNYNGENACQFKRCIINDQTIISDALNQSWAGKKCGSIIPGTNKFRMSSQRYNSIIDEDGRISIFDLGIFINLSLKYNLFMDNSMNLYRLINDREITFICSLPDKGEKLKINDLSDITEYLWEYSTGLYYLYENEIIHLSIPCAGRTEIISNNSFIQYEADYSKNCACVKKYLISRKEILLEKEFLLEGIILFTLHFEKEWIYYTREKNIIYRLCWENESEEKIFECEYNITDYLISVKYLIISTEHEIHIYEQKHDTYILSKSMFTESSYYLSWAQNNCFIYYTVLSPNVYFYNIEQERNVNLELYFRKPLEKRIELQNGFQIFIEKKNTIEFSLNKIFIVIKRNNNIIFQLPKKQFIFTYIPSEECMFNKGYRKPLITIYCRISRTIVDYRLDGKILHLLFLEKKSQEPTDRDGQNYLCRSSYDLETGKILESRYWKYSTDCKYACFLRGMTDYVCVMTTDKKFFIVTWYSVKDNGAEYVLPVSILGERIPLEKEYSFSEGLIYSKGFTDPIDFWDKFVCNIVGNGILIYLDESLYYTTVEQCEIYHLKNIPKCNYPDNRNVQPDKFAIVWAENTYYIIEPLKHNYKTKSVTINGCCIQKIQIENDFLYIFYQKHEKHYLSKNHIKTDIEIEHIFTVQIPCDSHYDIVIDDKIVSSTGPNYETIYHIDEKITGYIPTPYSQFSNCIFEQCHGFNSGQKDYLKRCGAEIIE